MATEMRMHKQKKKIANIFIKNLGMKPVKRGIQLISSGREKNIERGRERKRGSKEKGNNAQGYFKTKVSFLH